MGLFDRFFRKNKAEISHSEKHAEVEVCTAEAECERGQITLYNLSSLEEDTVSRLKRKYVAFDIETTGLNAKTDRIVEVGAVTFEEGEETERYETLIDPGIPMPPKAAAVNHITDEMLASAPREHVIYPVLEKVLKEVLAGEVIICAHNASFDMAFLAESMMRHGYSGNIFYIDTLAVSRRFLEGLRSYKLASIADYLEIENKHAHRAASDAEVCGKALWELLKCREDHLAALQAAFEESKPSEEEWAVCAYIQNILIKNGGELDLLRFSKNASGYVDAIYLSTFLRFKFAKKGTYFIAKKRGWTKLFSDAVPCSKAEGGESNVRIFFKYPSELEKYASYINAVYEKMKDEVETTLHCGILTKQDMENLAKGQHLLCVVDMEQYLAAAKQREEECILLEKEKEQKELERQEKKQRRAEEKKRKEEEKKFASEKPKKPVGRAILRLSDDLEIVRYETVAEAARQTGINDKSIRDAARGKQKRAGGYVWKYEDEL